MGTNIDMSHHVIPLLILMLGLNEVLDLLPFLAENGVWDGGSVYVKQRGLEIRPIWFQR